MMVLYINKKNHIYKIVHLHLSLNYHVYYYLCIIMFINNIHCKKKGNVVMYNVDTFN